MPAFKGLMCAMLVVSRQPKQPNRAWVAIKKTANQCCWRRASLAFFSMCHESTFLLINDRPPRWIKWKPCKGNRLDKQRCSGNSLEFHPRILWSKDVRIYDCGKTQLRREPEAISCKFIATFQQIYKLADTLVTNVLFHEALKIINLAQSDLVRCNMTAG